MFVTWWLAWQTSFWWGLSLLAAAEKDVVYEHQPLKHIIQTSFTFETGCRLMYLERKPGLEGMSSMNVAFPHLFIWQNYAKPRAVETALLATVLAAASELDKARLPKRESSDRFLPPSKYRHALSPFKAQHTLLNIVHNTSSDFRTRVLTMWGYKSVIGGYTNRTFMPVTTQFINLTINRYVCCSVQFVLQCR
jgi:hypothetical protein